MIETYKHGKNYMTSAEGMAAHVAGSHMDQKALLKDITLMRAANTPGWIVYPNPGQGIMFEKLGAALQFLHAYVPPIAKCAHAPRWLITRVAAGYGTELPCLRMVFTAHTGADVLRWSAAVKQLEILARML